MRRVALAGVLLTAGHVGVALAEPIYRCDNVYSQRPCAEGGQGEPIELHDERSEAQREQALDVQRRHREMADELARDRREFEAQPVSAAGIHGRGKAAEEQPPKKSRKRPSSKRSRHHKLKAAGLAKKKSSGRKKR